MWLVRRCILATQFGATTAAIGTRGVPPILGTTNVETGAIIGWGSRVLGAQTALAKLINDAVKKMAGSGLTKDVTIALRDFYAKAAARRRGNTAQGGNPAGARSELMGDILERRRSIGLW